MISRTYFLSDSHFKLFLQLCRIIQNLTLRMKVQEKIAYLVKICIRQENILSDKVFCPTNNFFQIRIFT